MSFSRDEGYFYGKMCYAAGLCGLAAAYVLRTSKQAAKFAVPVCVGSVISIGAALHLRNKLYLNDPGARAEYRREIASVPLSATLKSGRYSIEALLGLFSREDLEEMFTNEVGAGGSLHAAMQRFTLKVLVEMQRRGIVPLQQLRQRFDVDVQNSNGSFSTLWKQLSGDMPELIKLGIVAPRQAATNGVGSLHDLFFYEYRYVTAAGQSATNAAGANEAAANAGLPYGNIFEAYRAYGDFVRNNFNVSSAFWRGAVVQSGYWAVAPLQHLVRDGVLQLGANLSLTKDDIAPKWESYAMGAAAGKTPIVSLSAALAEVQCDKLLDAGLLDAWRLQSLVEQACPREYSTAGAALTEQTNIVMFLERYAYLFRLYPTAVANNLAGHFSAAWRQGCSAREQLDRDLANNAKIADNSEEEQIRNVQKIISDLQQQATKEQRQLSSTEKSLVASNEAIIANLQLVKKRKREQREQMDEQARKTWTLALQNVHRDFAVSLRDAGGIGPRSPAKVCSQQ